MEIATARWRILLLSLAAALFCVIARGDTVVVAAGTTIGVSPASRTAGPGDTVDVPVVISTDAVVRGIQFGFDFDPSVVQVNKVTEGTFLKSWAQGNGATTMLVPGVKIDNAKGTVVPFGIAVMGGPEKGGPSGSGTVATINLTVKAGASGRSPIKLTSVVVTDPSTLNVSGVVPGDGEVVVGTGGAAGQDQQASQDPQPAPAQPAQPTATQPAMPAPVQQPSLAAQPGAPTAVQSQQTAQAGAPQQQASGGQGSAPPATGGQAVPSQSSPSSAAQQPLPQSGLPAGQPATAAPGQPAATQAGQAQGGQGAAAGGSQPAAVPRVVRPRGSDGLLIPWEVIGGIGGGIVAAGVVSFALRRDEAKRGQE